MRNRRALERDRERLSLPGFFTRVRGAATEFSPLQLFGKYTATGLYIPNFSDLTKLFQDDEGTVPVTAAADPIGKIVDSGPSGTTVLQATDASRLIYQQGNAASRWVARGDGVADHAVTNLIPSTAMTIAVAVECNAVSDNIIGANDAGFTNRCYMQTTAAGLLSFNIGAGPHSGGADIRDIPGVAIARFDGSRVSLFWKPFTGSMVTLVNSAVQSGSPTSTNVLYLGGDNNNGTVTTPLDGDIYGAFVIKAALTNAEVEAVAGFFSR
jgi:hypothetical protein